MIRALRAGLLSMIAIVFAGTVLAFMIRVAAHGLDLLLAMIGIQ